MPAAAFGSSSLGAFAASSAVRDFAVACAREFGRRWALVGTIVLAAGLFWLTPRLPMVDLPQHAGQVALWRDLLLGVSPWAEITRINLFTPYLVGYGLALPLAFVMPAGAAIGCVLTIAYFAFVASSIRLRRDVGADERLDWLLVTPFFGFAWTWGLYTFLVAAPIGLQLVRLALRHAQHPTPRAALGLIGLGCALLFCHGLVFLFACLVGSAMALSRVRSLAALARAVAPYAVLAVACLAFFLASRNLEEPAKIGEVLFLSSFVERVILAPVFITGSFESDLIFLPGLAMMVLAPVVLGLRPTHALLPAVPVLINLAVYFGLPHFAFDTAYLYERFALFLLPFLVLVFPAPPIAVPTANLRQRIGLAMLVVGCWSGLAINAARSVAIAREQADFEPVLAAAEPNRRALAIIIARDSAANGHGETYMHHALWYQVEKHGLVDVNFAFLHPQVVRFRRDTKPLALESIGGDTPFDWRRHGGRVYDYYFVRHPATGPPAGLFDNPDCDIALVRSVATWSLYEKVRCRN